MNKKLSARVFLVFVFALFVLHGSLVAAPAEEGGTKAKKASVVQKSLAKNGPDITALTINRFWFQFTKEGKGVDKPAAGYYPKGTANAIYADGLVWVGKVTPADGQTVRAGGITYNTGLVAGAVINGVPEDPNGDNVYIYRIRRDYKTIYNEYKADKSKIAIKQDAADTKGVPISDITDKDIDDLYKQYDQDWNNWPVDRGAPYIDKNGNGKYDGPTVDEPGIAGADQVLWTVANDSKASAVSDLYKSRPIGIEQQLTIWGYARNNPLGDVVFKKYRIINRGTLRVDSMFVAQWSDPDLGNYGDDIAGSDAALSLGFVYNGNATDAEYAKFGLPPAAVGYDFFQGPLIKSSDPNKVGIFDLKYRPGYENLGMTSFGYFSAGSTISDPTLGSREDGTYENGTLNWWKLIRGFVPQLGPDKPFIDDKGNPTLYPLSGDPVARTGWLDNSGPPTFPPGDRRITLNSGPFTFATKDTQEVVVAVIGGVGADRISSFAVMRYNDRFAQSAYNVLFNLPSPPGKVPAVMTELDREVVIEWGSDIAKVAALESDVQAGGYEFEGYRVYQLSRPDASLSEGKLLLTTDKVNGIGLIFDDIFDPVSNQIIKYPIVAAPDLGLKRSISIKTDALRGGEPLANNQPYYFAVTAYSYSPLETAVPKILESEPARFTAFPKQIFGTRLSSTYGDIIKVEHTSGVSEATVTPFTIDPTKFTGKKYAVSLDTTGGEKKWKLTADGVKIYSGSNFGAAAGGDATTYPIIDGMFVQVANPLPLVNKAKSSFTGTKWLSAPGDFYFSDGYKYMVTTAEDGYNYLGAYSTTLDPANYKKIEIRFGGNETQKAYRYRRIGIYRFQNIVDVPFTVWDVQSNPARQLNVAFRDQNNNGQWNPGYVEVVFFMASTYQASGAYDDTDAKRAPRRDVMYIADFYSANNAASDVQPSVMTITPYYVMGLSDVYSFTPTAPVKNSTLAAADVEKINVFPNPYYGFSRIETSRFNRFVTFTNLPPNQKVTIRIFNLAGQHVRTLEKDDAQQILRWDLRNEANMPAASGMYVVFVDLPGIGKTKTLKVAIIQEQEVLDVF